MLSEGIERAAEKQKSQCLQGFPRFCRLAGRERDTPGLLPRVFCPLGRDKERRQVRRLFDAEVAGVFSDQPEARALQRARDAGVHAEALPATGFPSREAFDAAFFARVDAVRPDLVVCAGSDCCPLPFTELLPVALGVSSNTACR